LHPDKLQEVVKARGIEVGIITTPPQEAQKVADQLATAGVKGILNLSPTPVKAQPPVKVRNFFFTAALDSLVYFLTN
jgi:redox-sensing transcriptional repressor